MLAQNFKSAADLDITEDQLSALRKTLVLLETGKLTHVPEDDLGRGNLGKPKFTGHFNMSHSYIIADCGTVACIKGTAELISGVSLAPSFIPADLRDLFYNWRGEDPDTSQAATALRSYLTTGKANWAAAVSRSSRASSGERQDG